MAEDEIAEIWTFESLDNENTIRYNGQYVWETARRMCDNINAHEELIQITSLGEYGVVMRKAIKVIKEAHNVEQKRSHTARKKN